MIGVKLFPPRPFDDDFDFRFVLGNHVRGQNAAPENVRVNHRAASEDAAGIQHGVAAGFRAVAQQRAELAQAGVAGLAVHLDKNIPRHQFEVGNFYARAEVRLVAENGIADVIEMGRGGLIEQKRIFQFGRIADNTAVADDDVFADVGVVADLAIFSDDGRAFNHRAVFDDGVFADKNFFTDVSAAFALVAEFGFEIFGNVFLDFFERVPGESAAVENFGVFGLAQIK